jgi:hypothetical protein
MRLYVLPLLLTTGCSTVFGTLGGSLTGHPTTKTDKVWFKEGVSEADTATTLKKCEYQAKSNTHRNHMSVVFTQDVVRREAELRDLCMEAEGFSFKMQ